MYICIYIYTHTYTHTCTFIIYLFSFALLLVGFEVQQETNTALESIKKKENRRPSSFQMVILSVSWTLNLSSFAIQKLPEVCCLCMCVYLVLLYIVFYSLAQFFGGVRTATIHISLITFVLPISEHLNFWLCLSCGFLCFEVCILYLQRFDFSSTSSNSRVFFFSPLPPLLHSQLNHVIRKGALMKRSEWKLWPFVSVFPRRLKNKTKNKP